MNHARLARAAALVALALPACGGASAQVAAPAPVAPSGPDAHGFVDDDFLVGSNPMPETWTGVITLEGAKLEKPGAAGAAATFYRFHSSGEQVTEHYWKSKVATKADLRPGTPVACFMDAMKDDVYGPPASPEVGHSGRWQGGHVEDVLEIEKGWFKFGPGRCAVAAARLLVAGPRK